MTPLVGFLITILLTGICSFSGYDCSQFFDEQTPEGHIEGYSYPDSDDLEQGAYVDPTHLIVPGSYDCPVRQSQALTRLPSLGEFLWLA